MRTDGFWRKGEQVPAADHFGSSLEQTVGLADLVPRLAETVRTGLGAPWVRVSLPGAVSVAGEPNGEPELTVPLVRTDPQGLGRTVLGRIECGPKLAVTNRVTRNC